MRQTERGREGRKEGGKEGGREGRSEGGRREGHIGEINRKEFHTISVLTSA